MAPRFQAAFAIAAASLAAACTNQFSVSGASPAIPEVRVVAEKDLDCPQADIRIKEEVGGRFLAIGCGHTERYKAQCTGLKCIVVPGDGSIPFRDKPDPDSPVFR